jgi:acyl carrier protein
MTKDSILSNLQNLFREHFNNELLFIYDHTTQGDIPQWDSLNHAMLIDKIEQHYALKFDLMDMISMQSVGDICDKILAKQTS